MISRLLYLLPFCLLSSLSFAAIPSANNSIEALLDKSCSTNYCVDNYRVKFRQISYEPVKEQLTASFTLSPTEGIRYPIQHQSYEAQMTQSSFTGICRFRSIAKEEFDELREAVDTEGTLRLKSRLALCLQSVAERTDIALGR